MASITAIMRSGYYILRMLPHLVWLRVDMRARLRQATGAFEEQLLQSGLSQDIAHELAESYRGTNKHMIGQMTSPRFWARGDRA